MSWACGGFDLLVKFDGSMLQTFLLRYMDNRRKAAVLPAGRDAGWGGASYNGDAPWRPSDVVEFTRENLRVRRLRYAAQVVGEKNGRPEGRPFDENFLFRY